MNTVIYLRKSRADADDLSIQETLRKHKETLLEYAAEHSEIKITGIYEEVVSGDSLYARPQMLQLLQEAEQDKFEAVLCIDIQRLGRGSSSEQGMIFETFKFHNIKIITPRKTYDLHNETDEDQFEFESFYSRFELRKIKRRLHDGTMRSVQEGCYMANAPYGYEKTKIGKKTTLKIVEHEAAFVKMIFEMYANDGMGTHTIAQTINALGAKPRRGDQFNRTTVAAIIRNQVYIGKIVWNKKHTIKKGERGNNKYITIYNDKSKWQIYDGLHPPIIDEELFNKANEILASKYHKPYNDGTIKNPLLGILKCATCGNNMQRRIFANRGNAEYVLCMTKSCTPATMFKYVEKEILHMLAEKLKELEASNYQTKKIDYAPALSGAEVELKKLKQQKNKLYDLLERGVYDDNTFIERNNNLTERILKVEQQIEELKIKTDAQKRNNTKLFAEKIRSVLSLYDKSDIPTKNRLLKSVIENGTYYKAHGWKTHQFIVTLNYKSF